MILARNLTCLRFIILWNCVSVTWVEFRINISWVNHLFIKFIFNYPFFNQWTKWWGVCGVAHECPFPTTCGKTPGGKTSRRCKIWETNRKKIQLWEKGQDEEWGWQGAGKGGKAGTSTQWVGPGTQAEWVGSWTKIELREEKWEITQTVGFFSTS